MAGMWLTCIFSETVKQLQVTSRPRPPRITVGFWRLVLLESACLVYSSVVALDSIQKVSKPSFGAIREVTRMYFAAKVIYDEDSARSIIS